MEEKKFNEIILKLRKEKGLTQQELASKLNITDKAVSKWERGLSYPDITSISKLANILGVDSSYLLDLETKENKNKEDINKLVTLIFNAVGIAMGVCVTVLNILNQIEVKDSITMIGIGVTCIGLSLLSDKKKV